jgi:hypothetical protein
MPKLWLAGVLLAGAILVAGCVTREIEIITTPPGGTVEYDGRILQQRTPARFPFVWYGTHEIVVYKDGYHRERFLAQVKPPLYEMFPLDFFSENVFPGHVRDVHTFLFTLAKEEPMRQANAEEKLVMKKGLLQRAEEFRREAREKVGYVPPPEATPAEPAEKP